MKVRRSHLLAILVLICGLLALISAWAVLDSVPMLRWIGLMFLPAYLLAIWIQGTPELSFGLLAVLMFAQAMLITGLSLWLMLRALKSVD